MNKHSGLIINLGEFFTSSAACSTLHFGLALGVHEVCVNHFKASAMLASVIAYLFI